MSGKHPRRRRRKKKSLATHQPPVSRQSSATLTPSISLATVRNRFHQLKAKASNG